MTFRRPFQGDPPRSPRKAPTRKRLWDRPPAKVPGMLMLDNEDDVAEAVKLQSAPPVAPVWPERMWVVMKAIKFEFKIVGSNLPVGVDMRPMIGYAPLYATREDAEREHPGKTVLEVRRASAKE